MQAAHTAPSKLRAVSLYVFAVVLVLTATYLSLVVQVKLGNPFWLLFPVAVITSTWYCGKGPGWVAVGLSTLSVLYFFIPPDRSLAIKPEDIPFFLVFVACALISNWLVGWRKSTEDSLKRARDELELRVEERTAELKTSNEALVAPIEEQRRTEAALQVTRTELARVVRITTIGGLTSSIAHEVNVRIRSLISKATPERAQVAINDTITQAVALADGQAFRNNVSVISELGPNLPAVMGDGIQLQQVTLNLLMNGID